jgi:hypothetical protein
MNTVNIINNYPVIVDSSNTGVPIKTINNTVSILAHNAATLATARPPYMVDNLTGLYNLSSDYLYNGQSYQTLGYYNVGDNGGNTFFYSGSSTGFIDNFLIAGHSGGLGRFIAADRVSPIMAEKIGLIPNDTGLPTRISNTNSLLRYFESASNLGDKLETPAISKVPALMLGPYNYNLEGSLDIENRSYRTGFNSPNIIGTAGSNYAAQHLVSKAYRPYTSAFVLWGLGEDEYWWQERATDDDGSGNRLMVVDYDRPVNLRFENIVFNIPQLEKGNVFYLGDLDCPADNHSVRGVHFKGCYFTYADHFIRQDETYTSGGYRYSQVDAKPWLTSGGSTGYYLPTYRPTAIKLGWAYDVEIIDCSCRGFFVGLQGEALDGPKIDGWRTILVPRPLLLTGRSSEGQLWHTNSWASEPGIPGRITNVYSESDPGGLVFGQGMISNTRREYGYSNLYCNVSGHEWVPSTIGWHIIPSGNFVHMTGFPAGKDATDYFWDFMYVRLTPTIRSDDYWNGQPNPFNTGTNLTVGDPTPYIPPKDLLTIGVFSSGFYFANADGPSHVPTGQYATGALTHGTGVDIQRYFGSTIYCGLRVATSNSSINNNQSALINLPQALFVPSNNDITVFGWGANSLGQDPHDQESHNARLAMASAGNTNQLDCSVTWIGGNRQMNHPRAYSFGIPKSTSANRYNPEIEKENGFDLYFPVGRGQLGDSNVGRNALFIPVTDEDGSTTFCYHPPDIQDSNWTIAPLRLNSAGVALPCMVTVRYYVNEGASAQAGNTISVYDGATTHNKTVTGASVGWHTYEVNVTPTASAIYILRGPTRNVLVESVGINYYQDRNFKEQKTSSTTIPTTGEYPNDGDYGIHVNTASGTIYQVYNYGGSIKSTQLL